MNSFYKCASGGRSVVVWPTITGESGFYDVVVAGPESLVDRLHAIGRGESPDRTIDRVTAYEAASIVVTELGAPLSTTVDSLAGMIARWRAEFDAMGREPIR